MDEGLREKWQAFIAARAITSQAALTNMMQNTMAMPPMLQAFLLGQMPLDTEEAMEQLVDHLQTRIAMRQRHRPAAHPSYKPKSRKPPQD